ncbi:ABC-F type ribosomal protection protein [Alkalibacterium iburiense]|uniref:ABC-F type ribosomal protection protein n=1 Tax=Alkalibacterium iburiense TaxID=290589 RepID=A0ABP3GYC0_9LACT
MALVTLHNVKKSFGDRLLFEVDHLSVHKGNRIGLVGTNGSGKTTLLKLLSGEIEPDEGSLESHALISFLPQLKESSQTKSGGEVTADYVIQALNEKSQVLLADEPTTHLDMNHIEWVEKAFLKYHGAYIVISHDRAFLDNVCETIWELDNQTIKIYSGNYSDYKEEKEKEKQFQQTEHEKYIKKSKQLQEAKVMKAKQARDATKRKVPVGDSEYNLKGASDYFQSKAKKLHSVQKSIETRLDKLEKVEKPKEDGIVKMEVPDSEMIRQRFIIRGFDFEGHVPGKLLWKPVNISLKGGEKVGLIGSNGSGKTTLIRQLLSGHPDLVLSPAMKTGYFAQNLNTLDTDKSILENVSEEAVQTETLIRIVLAQLSFTGDDVFKKVSVLSGGERVKVSLAKLLVGDYNTLILDEPTNFLDIQAVEALENLLKNYDGTLIVVSHDRAFISSIVDKLWIIEETKLTEWNGTYSEWEQSSHDTSLNEREEELMRIENQLTSVLSELSLNPSEEKEKQFQDLLNRKRMLEK